jgi:hypothetical protein
MLVANDKTARIAQPREQALDFPAPLVASKWTRILRLPSLLSVGRDELHAEGLAHAAIELVVVVRIVVDQPFS